jgi:AhpD family alkylhydroperoxidase
MSRVAPVDPRCRPPLLRVLNAVTRRTLGHELTPLNTVAHNPGFVLPYLATSRFVRGRTDLDPEVRALAVHLVATINGCAWCRDLGRFAARRAGIPAAKLDAVADHATDPRFTPDERAALAYAAAVTEVGAHVPDALFAELRRHFSERDIVELTMVVAAENLYNRVTAPLAIESQGLCPVPFPAPANATPTRA